MFVGNPKIESIAKIIATDIRAGRFNNILIIGKSGYGKTTLAKYIAKLSLSEYKFSYGFNYKINYSFPINIIDEVHTVKTFEALFRDMDKKETELIFTTTELGDLPEPFINRCFVITIEDYTFEQLLVIAEYYNSKKFNEDIIKEVVNRSRGVPRVIRSLISWLNSYSYHVENMNLKVAKEAMDLHGYFDEGYTIYDIRYLDTLRRFGGTLSLASIVKTLGLPKDTVENYIEPFLLSKGKIKITNKGRSLNE